MYLSYAGYQSLGGTLTNTAFALLEFKARSLIDSYTQKRIQNMVTIPESVEKCMFELIGKLDTESQTGGGMITSESSGSYSYSVDLKSAKQSMADTIRTYLAWQADDNGIYLLSAGVE